MWTVNWKLRRTRRKDDLVYLFDSSFPRLVTFIAFFLSGMGTESNGFRSFFFVLSANLRPHSIPSAFSILLSLLFSLSFPRLLSFLSLSLFSYFACSCLLCICTAPFLHPMSRRVDSRLAVSSPYEEGIKTAMHTIWPCLLEIDLSICRRCQG